MIYESVTDTGREMEDKELKRNMEKEEARAKRNKRRKKIVLLEKIVIALVIVGVLAGGGILVYSLLPEIKLAKQLEAASEFIQTEDYDDAIASCEEALEIDSSSVQAYQAMAGAYLNQEDIAAAEQVLYQGWETTHDESLLQYYCTVLLNEAVAEINAQNCNLMTLEKCIAVLEKDYDNADAFNLMNVCYERLFTGTSEQEGLLCDAQMESGCGFTVYRDLMLRMLLVYEENPTEELKAEILKFAEPGDTAFALDIEHLAEYQELLSRIGDVGSNEQTLQLTACVDKAIEVQALFAEAFTIFESEDFAPIKDFMNKPEYIAIRDEFIAGTMEYWAGQTYIPVSRENMTFTKEEGGWKFAFADYEACEAKSGVISVWGAKQEDAGVQRLCISYEPASETGEYYPHTTYEVIYLYSNVEIDGEYVPQMNYRFETRVATPEGTTTDLIGDWGGEHEWTTEF